MNVSALVSRLQARGSRAASFVSSSRWLSGFVFDLRSLALFRILFGIVILGDLIYRAGFITDFYTDGGVLPRQVLAGNPPKTWWLCLHALSGGAGLQGVLFFITGVSVASMIVGYHTRVSTVLTWVLVTSLHTRNLSVLQGGDDIVRVMLFWSIFAPLGARFSLDRALSGEQEESSHSHVSLGTFLLALQLCIIYWCTGLLKFHPVWYLEGSAAYYALSLEEFTKPAGMWLVQFYPLLRGLTFATLGAELLFPMLVFLPIVTGWCRGIVVFGFILFHLGLFITMHLGPFPWQCIACWMLFLPSGAWDRVYQTSIGERLARLGCRVSFLVAAARGAPPRPARQDDYKLSSLLASLIMVCVVTWNIAGFPRLRYAVPEFVRRVVTLVGLEQNWAMFAPFPYRVDGWFVVEGTSKDGSAVDMWNEGGTLSFEPPANVAATYRNYMWRKYLTNMYDRGYGAYPASFAHYLCRVWNAPREGGQRVRGVSIYHMTVKTPLPTRPRPAATKDLFWQDVCPQELSTP